MKRFYLPLVLLLMLGGLAACLPAATPLPPLPTDTPPPPTETPTPTVVWFPPTPTFTPLPTIVQSQAITPTVALIPETGERLFSDDFTDPSLWTLGVSPAGSVALSQQELTLAVSQEGGYLYSVRRKTELGNFYAEITASPSLCKDSDEYGLLLRVSPSMEFFRFSLTCDGQARVDRYLSGRASSPQPLTLTGSVPPGAPSVSRLAVSSIDKEMRFFVNGDYLFSVSDSSLIGGTLGVFARSNGDTPVTVNFSDLVVYRAR
jgi:hypothetical protein